MHCTFHHNCFSLRFFFLRKNRYGSVVVEGYNLVQMLVVYCHLTMLLVVNSILIKAGFTINNTEEFLLIVHWIAVVVVVFCYCRAKTNTQITNSANIKQHDLAQREEAKDQNKNVASSSNTVAESAPPLRNSTKFGCRIATLKGRCCSDLGN